MKYPTLEAIWTITNCAIFIREDNGMLTDVTFNTVKKMGNYKVVRAIPTSYPMHKNVLEIKIKEG